MGLVEHNPILLLILHTSRKSSCNECNEGKGSQTIYFSFLVGGTKVHKIKCKKAKKVCFGHFKQKLTFLTLRLTPKLHPQFANRRVMLHDFTKNVRHVIQNVTFDTKYVVLHYMYIRIQKQEVQADHGKNIQHYDFYIFDSKKGRNQNRGSLEAMQVNERIFVLLSHLTSVFGLVFVHNCVGPPKQIEIVTP